MIDRGKLRVTNLEDFKRRIRQTKPDAVFTDRWLSISEFCEKVGMSRSTYYRKSAANELPACVRWGNTAKWLESDVDQWMQSMKDVL